jgi:peptidylamidoglycolate lyase
MIRPPGLLAFGIVTATLGACVGENQASPASASNGIAKGGDDRTGGYEVVEGWWKPAPNHDNQWGWGDVAGVAVDNVDRIVVIARGDRPSDPTERMSGRTRATNYVVVADGDGNIVEQWTQWDTLLTLPHQVYIDPYDPERHVWVVDGGGADGRGQVVKFSNDGTEVVMRLVGDEHLRTREEARARSDWGPYTYGLPSKLAFFPDGSFLLADGYWNSRIIRYTEDGSFVSQFGELGTGPGQFDLLHGLAVDDDGRIYVADRMNGRIQIFTENGRFIEEWPDILDPVNIWLDADGWVWVMDGTLNRIMKFSRAGELQYHWGAYSQAGTLGRGPWAGGLSLPHQMDMDEDGNVYVASYSAGRVDKFVPRPGADPSKLLGPRLSLE